MKARLPTPLEFSYNYEVTVFLLKWLLELQYLGTVEEIRAQNNGNSLDSNKITLPFAFPKMLSSLLYLYLGSRGDIWALPSNILKTIPFFCIL